MSSDNWHLVTNGLSPSTDPLGAGVTSALTTADGGKFVFAVNALDVVNGAFAYRATQAEMNPLAKGGAVSAVLQRRVAGSAPFIYVCLDSDDAESATSYCLGISDAKPSHIVLSKCPLASFGVDAAPHFNNVLARGSELLTAGSTWVHLRLMVACNLSGSDPGDSVLSCFRNSASPSSPVWQPIDGIPPVIVDDVGQVLTGSAPGRGGFAGWGARLTGKGGVACFDVVKAEYQTG